MFLIRDERRIDPAQVGVIDGPNTWQPNSKAIKAFPLPRYLRGTRVRGVAVNRRLHSHFGLRNFPASSRNAMIRSG